MRNHRHKGASPAPVNAGMDTNRKIHALVYLLEEKGVLAPGEFEDAIMNLKVQLGDQPPQNGRPRQGGNGQAGNNAGGGRRPGPDYIGPERRRQLESEREEGQERRDNNVRTAVAHIAGDVVSDGDGHVISGVQLILRRSSQTNTPIQFRSTKSDMQGRFVFLNLPLNKEGEPDQAYTYGIEARYRNKTIYVNPAVDMTPSQTTHIPMTASLSEE